MILRIPECRHMVNTTITKTVSRRTFAGIAPAIGVALLLPLRSTSQESKMNPFGELIEVSRTEKKGLTFYIGGQTVPGIVTKVNADTVEVRNQSHSRVLIRLDRVDAVALA
jgi:hypothetical protein